MKIHKNKIYDTFRYNKEGKNETLNDILKGTKSVLASKSGFKNYIHNYSLFTKKPTFKEPYITEYPLLKTESASLVPIKNGKNSSKNSLINSKIGQKKKLIFPNKITQNKTHLDFLEKYNKKFYSFLRLHNESGKKKLFTKNIYKQRFNRYNSLFLDFFNKWNGYDNHFKTISEKSRNNNIIFRHFESITDKEESKKNNVNINIQNFNIKERYSNLCYDENEIFNTDYKNFILNKINYIRENKIKNFTNYIESSFTDSNEKEIKLKLESIKLNFKPQIQNKTIIKGEDSNSFYIYLPLAYVFLFYYEDFGLFQKILMKILYFKKDYKTIIFDDEELYNLLNSIEIKDKEEDNKEEKDVDYLAVFKKGKKIKNNIIDKNSNDFRKTFNKNNNIGNKLFLNKMAMKNSSKNLLIKTKIIHSNNIQKEIPKLCVTKENKKNTNLENDENKNFYNEYYFIWETPKITYKVKMEMPKIYFEYEGIDYNIISYCSKNLFLYLYKNNFINWDFYALNYIFSIKSFREFILQFFSINKDYALLGESERNLKKMVNIKTISKMNNLKYLSNFTEYKNGKNDKNLPKYLLITNKKIYNQINENNESYYFFYSDINQKNYIFHFYSYSIIIEYKKLNPKIKWEFYLNFKQMKYLNEVSKYEELISFLPKIIKTNFEYGELNINFGVFDENFNAKILDIENKEIGSKKKNNEIKIEINKPYIQMEKAFKNEKSIAKQELNNKFLQNLNNINMTGWSKKLLIMMNVDLIPEKLGFCKDDSFKAMHSNLKNSYANQFKIIRNTRQKHTYVGNKGIKNEDFILKSFKKLKTQAI